ncbi:hypothetical protein ACFYXF_51320 [Streptomyces sp. NPDC002680]|uniref:hypothetical protein n=1 Tax=Streptomyces sp. NPDC002680 TaxID=3364659 RepID=UPI0036CCAD77
MTSSRHPTSEQPRSAAPGTSEQAEPAAPVPQQPEDPEDIQEPGETPAPGDGYEPL